MEIASATASSSGEGGSGRVGSGRDGTGSSSYLKNMSTGASWRTLLACLAASYSFGTVFWMNVNLLKNIPKTFLKRTRRLFLFWWTECLCFYEGGEREKQILREYFCFLTCECFFTGENFSCPRVKPRRKNLSLKCLSDFFLFFNNQVLFFFQHLVNKSEGKKVFVF